MAAATSGDVPLEGASEDENDRDPATIAAEDQAVSAARHVAQCTVRFHQVLRDGEIPPGLAAELTKSWLKWFVCDGGDPDQNGEDDD